METILYFLTFTLIAWIIKEELTNPKESLFFLTWVIDKQQYLDLLVKYGGSLKGRELRIAMMEEKKGIIRSKDFREDMFYLQKQGWVKILPPFDQLDVPLSQADILLCTIQIDEIIEEIKKYDKEMLRGFNTNTTDDDFESED